MPRRLLVSSTLTLALLASGCGGSSLFSASTWDPFGLRWRLDPGAQPLRVGLCYEYEGVFDIRNWGKKPPWDNLRRQMEDRFQRPVRFENYTPFQIAYHLSETGDLDFALVCATDYLEMSKEGPPGKALAVSQARVRQGVIVARADSDITDLAGLAGHRFAFGPKNDPTLHRATLARLESAGVPASTIKTLLPGQLQHHISSREAAKEVAYLIGTDAGVIEAEEFDSYPETGGRWFPLPVTFSKDLFRVLGRTEASRVDTMGEGPFLASERLDDETVDKMRAFLLGIHQEHASAVRSLGFARFRDVADLDSEMKRLATSPAP